MKVYVIVNGKKSIVGFDGKDYLLVNAKFTAGFKHSPTIKQVSIDSDDVLIFPSSDIAESMLKSIDIDDKDNLKVARVNMNMSQSVNVNILKKSAEWLWKFLAE